MRILEILHENFCPPYHLKGIKFATPAMWVEGKDDGLVLSLCTEVQSLPEDTVLALCSAGFDATPEVRKISMASGKDIEWTELKMNN